MKDFIKQVEDVITPALTSQYNDDYQQGQAKIAAAIGELIDALPADPRIEPDPDHPGRPHTLDFARLSAAVRVNDERSESETIPEIFEADAESLTYMVEQRLRIAFGLTYLMLPISIQTMLQAAEIDGFTLGMQFERRGGARPEETGDAGDKEGSE